MSSSHASPQDFNNPEHVTYFAQTDARNKRTPFGIKELDRSRHVYVIGKTGMGKSTMLENMAIQDIQGGEGMAFIDPHGKTAELLLDYIPKDRIDDVLYIAPFDTANPIAFNVMEDVGEDKRHLVANGLMSTFKKIWQDAWSARMEYILNNTILALLEYPDATLLSINRMYSDKKFRQKVVDNISDMSVAAFWKEEFAGYSDRYAAEATPAIQNKIGQFTANPLIRNIIGQPKSSFDLRKIMDERKIVIINLSKGKVGEDNANLLGSMLVTKIYLAAMSRADLSNPEMEKAPTFHLFVDEFQSFANESFASILSESRKYNLALTMAHQYIAQMPEEVRDAVFGNVGTMVTFRIGGDDAAQFEKEFAPYILPEDIVNLGIYQIFLKLMINGVTSHPFSAETLPPLNEPQVKYRDEVIAASRLNFANERYEVERKIKNYHLYGVEEPTDEETKHYEKSSKSGKGDGKKSTSKPTQRSGGDNDKSRSPNKSKPEATSKELVVTKSDKKETRNPFASLKAETKSEKTDTAKEITAVAASNQEKSENEDENEKQTHYEKSSSGTQNREPVKEKSKTDSKKATRDAAPHDLNSLKDLIAKTSQNKGSSVTSASEQPKQDQKKEEKEKASGKTEVNKQTHKSKRKSDQKNDNDESAKQPRAKQKKSHSDAKGNSEGSSKKENNPSDTEKVPDHTNKKSDLSEDLKNIFNNR